MMFGNTENKLNSILGSESDFIGELTIKGILRIDGAITGKIQADQLILSETADVKGDLRAKRIIVGGRIEGSLRASELVEIQAKGKVTGDVFTDKILVAVGGEFNGRIEMKDDASKVLDFDSQHLEASAK